MSLHTFILSIILSNYLILLRFKMYVYILLVLLGIGVHSNANNLVDKDGQLMDSELIRSYCKLVQSRRFHKMFRLQDLCALNVKIFKDQVCSPLFNLFFYKVPFYEGSYLIFNILLCCEGYRSF